MSVGIIVSTYERHPFIPPAFINQPSVCVCVTLQLWQACGLVCAYFVSHISLARWQQPTLWNREGLRVCVVCQRTNTLPVGKSQWNICTTTTHYYYVRIRKVDWTLVEVNNGIHLPHCVLHASLRLNRSFACALYKWCVFFLPSPYTEILFSLPSVGTIHSFIGGWRWDVCVWGFGCCDNTSDLSEKR